ncbi:hypothetical protein SAMN05421505_106122 [Sinosporangium album]|uniref:Peptidase inhibitor family I36 n=1 Tax=Sinosporangium album TaxID=504805 RepID=A0A1G7VZ17_9ACTN|nr:hypothetical protein [Sinosporangium album]SDG64992.1 hypothetical protein SAMN05421505_106122 [Sinosporangium album]
MKLKKWAGMFSAATLLTAGALAGMAGTAHAIPEQCSTTQNGPSSATSYCATGTGQHRVVVAFVHANPWIGIGVIEGPWADVGSSSTINVLGTIRHVTILKR